jgi:G:T/U-mismatch repair DNA glycosylase
MFRAYMSIETHPFVSGKWQENLIIDTSAWVKELDYFGYVPSKEANTLFLGTFPTFEVVNKKRHNGNMEFFYGSTSNQFWKILSWVTGSTLTNENDCISLLHSNRLAITDILFKVDRISEMSGDSDIKVLQYNNIGLLLNKFSSIDSIVLTSGGKSPIRKSSANSAGAWLFNYLGLFGHDPRLFTRPGYQKSFLLQNGKEVSVSFLFSPSNSANISLEGIIRKHDLNKILLSFLTDKTEINLCNRLRILQYAYILKKGGMQIESSISDCLRFNSDLVTTIFR